MTIKDQMETAKWGASTRNTYDKIESFFESDNRDTAINGKLFRREGENFFVVIVKFYWNGDSYDKKEFKLIKYNKDKTCNLYCPQILSRSFCAKVFNRHSPAIVLVKGKKLVVHSNHYGTTPERRYTCRTCKGEGKTMMGFWDYKTGKAVSQERICFRCNGKPHKMVGGNPRGVDFYDGIRIAPTGAPIGEGKWPEDFPEEAFRYFADQGE